MNGDGRVRRNLMMETSNIVLCSPLKQLKGEHVKLRKDMDLFYEITEEIEFDSGPAVVQLFGKLYQQILVFNDKLKTHSKREEEGLFPLMSRRLKKNDKTIEEMEREHKKAEQHLQDFLTEAYKAGSSIDENDVPWVTVYAVQAHATLIQHFAKEEKMLFPLAEKILSVDEKKELGRLLQAFPYC